jgi:hypothetical protein
VKKAAIGWMDREDFQMWNIRAVFHSNNLGIAGQIWKRFEKGLILDAFVESSLNMLKNSNINFQTGYEVINRSLYLGINLRNLAFEYVMRSLSADETSRTHTDHEGTWISRLHFYSSYNLYELVSRC